MFGFLADVGNYADRVVGRDDFDWGFISTCSVSDGAKPYETAVKHKLYCETDMVIVEAYDNKEAAEAGHKKWLGTMTAKVLPEQLTDCCNSEVAQLADAFGAENIYKRVQS